MLPSLGDWKGTSILVKLQSVVRVTASQLCVENSTIGPYQWVEKELLEGHQFWGLLRIRLNPQQRPMLASISGVSIFKIDGMMRYDLPTQQVWSDT